MVLREREREIIIQWGIPFLKAHHGAHLAASDNCDFAREFALEDDVDRA
jgi:hypothetical protein